MNPQITILYAQLNSDVEHLVTLLPDSEQARAKRFTHSNRRGLFILGRLLLSEGLYVLTNSKKFNLTYEKHGKPLLTSPQNWQFNLTHSGNHIFLALCPTIPIGVDSEILRSRNFTRLSQQLFTPLEQEAIALSPTPELIFYRLWTCYEAKIKLLGLSVFSKIPKQMTLYTSSYQHNNLLFSVCCSQPINDINFYRYTLPNRKLSKANSPQVIT